MKGSCHLVFWSVVALVACVPRQADQLFQAGDYSAAIDLYEDYLVRRAELSADDASLLMRLAIAYGRAESPRYDPETSEHYLRVLTDLFPHTEQGLEAEIMLAGMRAAKRVERLEEEIAQRDKQLKTFDNVLRSLATTGQQLRDEVAGKEEVRAGLEGRVDELTRQARILSSEIAQLESELEALKQIDLESVAAEPPD